ncbi:MAG: UDP-N-acetylglucosamine 2-epimerase (non-hydrolyzing) [Bacteroidia bacterium]|nr:UDP-N-acetylglucosamine 2-epimerase (non-hydrolyzing) [Bacteroidia bacterium]
MIKIVTIIGARPQIIKSAALSRAIKNYYSNTIQEIIVHTGQHYDENMSAVFFNELEIPQPKYNLAVGSGKHGATTAKMIEGIEKILLQEQPNYLVLYGDTNSTLAGSIAASKIHIPVVHIEAGLRSFNKRMPEEINRILCDHQSTLLFCPTDTALVNLKNEGFNLQNKKASIDAPVIYQSGDVMYDNSVYFAQKAKEQSTILTTHQLNKNNFILVTIHRDYNTDNPARMQSIFTALNTITKTHQIKLVLPLHPRTKKLLENSLGKNLYESILNNLRIQIIPPASFLDMIALEDNCKMILTDSGGVQKEAYFFKKPCLILRSETEWVELLQTNTALICDADEEKILNGVAYFFKDYPTHFPEIFGNAKASEFICQKMIEHVL